MGEGSSKSLISVRALATSCSHVSRATGKDPAYVAVLDRTAWDFGQTAVNVLMIEVAQNGIAFPVVWSVLDHDGESGAEEHADLLEQEQIRALVADREFTGSAFLEELSEREIPFVIRLKKDRRVGPPSWKRSFSAKMFARTCAPGHAVNRKDLEGPGRSRIR